MVLLYSNNNNNRMRVLSKKETFPKSCKNINLKDRFNYFFKFAKGHHVTFSLLRAK